jgi:hypothetical protein
MEKRHGLWEKSGENTAIKQHKALMAAAGVDK